jgi:hypothetical protein
MDVNALFTNAINVLKESHETRQKVNEFFGENGRNNSHNLFNKNNILSQRSAELYSILYDIANGSFIQLENPLSNNNDEYYQPYTSNSVPVVTNNAYNSVSKLTLPEGFEMDEADRELLEKRIKALATLNNEVKLLYKDRPTSGGRRKNRPHKKRHTRHKAKKNQRKTRRHHK